MRQRLNKYGGLGWVLLVCAAVGCGQSGRTYVLDEELARSSLEDALQAWVDGQTPEDLQPTIIMGDQGWAEGRKLGSFEILPDEETTDGSNLYIRVKRKFADDNRTMESKVTYIVGTSPAITIFPQ
ncbi:MULTISPECIES: hypothetical protein [unclassified Schlesneria]|uniref:hypothetical protein n=2 Tax=Planctomycetaceae TaxID=126 RepID=UPI00359F2774